MISGHARKLWLCSAAAGLCGIFVLLLIGGRGGLSPGSGADQEEGGIGAESRGDGMFVTMVSSDIFFTLRPVEEVVPMECVGNRCEVFKGHRGYFRFLPSPVGVPVPVDTIFYQDVEIDVEYVTGLFWGSKTRKLWLFSSETT